MIRNPTREGQGGDVEGETPIDVTQGPALRVAKASFDPGYPFGESLPDMGPADLLRGYCDYGRSIGEGRRTR
jgi:hypothetical protein